jgi:autotransporter passenger strand-loop-strand repeat protein
MASGTTLNSSAQYDYGTASSTTVNSGSYQVVETGGTSSGATLNGGGFQIVESGGTASGTTLNSGAQYDYGTASSTTVNSGAVQVVETGGTASGTTLSGGSETIMSGGTATGIITFTGSGLLTLNQSTNVNNFQISVFNASSNKLDLADVAYGGQTTLSFVEATNNTSGTLTVSDTVHTANITLLGQYTTQNFTTASDGHGGTIIFV